MLKDKGQFLKNLEIIESALFLLAIDDVMRPFGSLTANSKDILLGNFDNRWFDKSLQMIICYDRMVGFNMEHSGFDGSILAKLSTEIFKNFNNNCQLKINKSSCQISKTKPLKWQLSDKNIASIIEAKKQAFNLIKSVHISAFSFEEFGAKHDVDIVVQLALQLAYFRLKSKVVCFYESVSTRCFYYGRTEALRSVTNQSVALIKAIIGKQPLNKIKKLLKITITTHKTRRLDCQNGKGVDRHLMALELIAKENNLHPKIFSDYSYQKILKQNIVSTSAFVKQDGFDSVTFAPVTKNGFGVFYTICDDKINFNISHNSERQLSKFCKLFIESLSYLNQISL